MDLPVDLIESLRAHLPGDAVLTDRAALELHARDSAPFGPAGRPAVVARPRTIEQVRQVLRTAHALRVPVVPQGARTGLAGGANAVEGCVVLSMTGMDQILEVDREVSAHDAVRVRQAGVQDIVGTLFVAEVRVVRTEQDVADADGGDGALQGGHAIVDGVVIKALEHLYW